MVKRIFVPVLLVAAVLAMLVWSPVNAGGGKKAKLQFRSVVSADRTVQPSGFGTVRARCPKGFAATGAGLALGAIEPVIDMPTPNGRAWLSDGFNPSASTPFEHSLVVRCTRGRNGLAVRPASVGAAPEEIAEAREAFLAAREKR